MRFHCPATNADCTHPKCVGAHCVLMDDPALVQLLQDYEHLRKCTVNLLSDLEIENETGCDVSELYNALDRISLGTWKPGKATE